MAYTPIQLHGLLTLDCVGSLSCEIVKTRRGHLSQVYIITACIYRTYTPSVLTINDSIVSTNIICIGMASRC
jgi:hypothetical protein